MNRLQLAGTSVLVAGLTLAAVPPALVNYQGVLRDSMGNPLSGTYDMVFRFHSADLGGDEILVDSHTGGAAIAVTGGLFNVQLGSGTVSDGSGPGAYTSLASVFANHADVWLAVQVGAEVLSPRTRIVAAGYALNARSLEGRTAAQFLDTSSTVQAKYGVLAISAPAGTPGVALQATGPGGGIIAWDTDGGGQAWIGQGPFGVDAFGFGAVGGAGGRFVDSSGTGQAYLGFGDYGIDAFGSWPSGAGGRFNDTVYSGEAYLAVGDTGIDAYGTYAGGIFRNGTPASYTEQAYLAFGDIGVQGYGDVAGGLFSDRTQTGVARLGYGDSGIEASGSVTGGYFELPHLIFDPAAASTFVAYSPDGVKKYGLDAYGETLGVHASGPNLVGLFEGTVWSGETWLGYGDYGMRAFGNFAGGHFYDTNGSGWAYIGHDVYKVFGNGFVSFVQNHPTEKDKVIVYAAPEGDEVAVYTRGTARLIHGEARVALGPTFAWVTNPDIGLTVHLTPRDEAVPLAVVSVTPTELVVRGTSKRAIEFDYLVYGLRIGFEEASVVQPKLQEAFIPSMDSQNAVYHSHPELRQFNALERHKGARAGQAESAVDFSRSQALRAAIQEYDPAVHGRVEDLQFEEPGASSERDAGPGRQAAADRTAPVAGVAPSPVSASDRAWQAPSRDPTQHARLLRPSPASVDVREPVEPGDVLANDPREPGILGRASAAADPGVIGIVVGDPGTTWTETAPIALAGTIATCKVDAGFGAIRPNDLLVASPTPGHAMRATDTAPGTIVGKALEPLDAGIGVIRVLVMSR